MSTVITDGFRVSRAILASSSLTNPKKPNRSALDVQVKVDTKKVAAQTDGFDELPRVFVKIPKYKVVDGKREVEWVDRELTFTRDVISADFTSRNGIHVGALKGVNKQLIKRHGVAVFMEYGNAAENAANPALRDARTIHAQEFERNAAVKVW